MKFGLYSVFDVAVCAYLPPFVLITDQAAVRAFALCARDPEHMFCKSPISYRLFKVGYFDDERGIVEHCMPVMLCDAQAAQVSGAVVSTAVMEDGCVQFDKGV